MSSADFGNKHIREEEHVVSTLPHFVHPVPTFTTLEQEQVHAGDTYGMSHVTYEDKKAFIPSMDIDVLMSRTSFYRTEPIFRSPRAEITHHDTYEMAHTTLAHTVAAPEYQYHHVAYPKVETETLAYHHNTYPKVETQTSVYHHDTYPKVESQTSVYHHETYPRAIDNHYSDLHKSSATVLYEDPVSLTHASNAFGSHVYSHPVQPTYPSYETHHYPEYSSHPLEHSEKLTESMSQKLSHIDTLIQDIKTRNGKIGGSHHENVSASPSRVHFQDATISYKEYEPGQHHSPKYSHHQEEGSFSPALCNNSEITNRTKKEHRTEKVKEHHKKEEKKEHQQGTQFVAKAVVAMLVLLLAAVLSAQLFCDFQ